MRASKPGIYSLEPNWVEIETNESIRLTGEYRRVRRKPQPVALEVKGRPQGLDANVPVGEFELTCPETTWHNEKGDLVTEVRAKGTGPFGKANLKLSGKTRTPIVVDSSGVESDQVLAGRMVYSKTYTISFFSVHEGVEEVTAPQVTFDYWNPASQETERATCEVRTLRAMKRATSTPAAPIQRSVPAGKRFILSLVELAVAGLLVFSGVLVLRAIRRG